jgi:hypothetical protein
MDDRIALALTQQQWTTIRACLMEVPFRIAAPLLQEIDMQLQAAQRQAAQLREVSKSEPR